MRNVYPTQGIQLSDQGGFLVNNTRYLGLKPLLKMVNFAKGNQFFILCSPVSSSVTNMSYSFTDGHFGTVKVGKRLLVTGK